MIELTEDLREELDGYIHGVFNDLVSIHSEKEWEEVTSHPFHVQGHSELEEGLAKLCIRYLIKKSLLQLHEGKKSGDYDQTIVITKNEVMKAHQSILGSEDFFDYERILGNDAVSEEDVCFTITMSYLDEDEDAGPICKELLADLPSRLKNSALLNFVNYILLIGVDKSIDISFTRYNIWSNWCSSHLGNIMESIAEDIPGCIYNPFETGTSFKNLVDSNRDTYYFGIVGKFYLYYHILIDAVFGDEVSSPVLNNLDTLSIPNGVKSIITAIPVNVIVNVGTENETHVDTWFLKNISDLLSDKTSEVEQIICTVRANLLYDGKQAHVLRHTLTETGTLDTIILLPGNSYAFDSTALAVLKFKKNRKSDASVKLVDLTNCWEYEDEDDEDQNEFDEERALNAISTMQDGDLVRMIPYSRFAEEEYDWDFSRYFEDTTDLPHGYCKCRLCDIMKPVFGDGYGFMHWENKIVNPEDLSSDCFEHVSFPSLDMETCEAKKKLYEDEYFMSYNSIDKDFIAIDYTDGLRTAWVEVDYSSIFHSVAVEESIFAYRINTDIINPDYLRLVIKEAYENLKEEGKLDGDKVDKEFLIRTAFVTYPKDVNEQIRIFNQARLTHAIDNARKEGLDEAIEFMKQEYMMEIRMRKHDMKPFISQLDSSAKLSDFYLNKIEGNEDVVAKIRENLAVISNSVIELRRHLDRLNEEEKYGTPEPFNFIDALNGITGSFGNHTISLNLDEYVQQNLDDSKINISPVDFSSLVNTIIENAVEHAFVDQNGSYNLNIHVAFDKIKDSFVIDFMNDGKLLPEGIDKFNYGLKGNKGVDSKGTGFGGYRVKTLARHYGGDYDVFSNPVEKYTCIRIILPKYRES